jgi:hypothetical protein
VRKELGIADDVKVVIFNFGGQVSEDTIYLLTDFLKRNVSDFEPI